MSLQPRAQTLFFDILTQPKVYSGSTVLVFYSIFFLYSKQRTGQIALTNIYIYIFFCNFLSIAFTCLVHTPYRPILSNTKVAYRFIVASLCWLLLLHVSLEKLCGSFSLPRGGGRCRVNFGKLTRVGFFNSFPQL